MVKIIPYLGLQNRKEAAKANARAKAQYGSKAKEIKPEVHIIFYIMCCNLVLAAVMLVLNYYGILYSPLSCEPVLEGDGYSSIATTGLDTADIYCHESMNVFATVQSTTLTLFMFIFGIGPLNLFLRIKEGKTSVDKIVEGYEDSRIDFMQMAHDHK